jgi:UDP-glucuronate 4-epimerase
MAIVKFIRHIDRGLELVLYGEGRYERDYTYIDDIVDGILAAMQRRQGHEIFNLGGHRTTSVIDLVRMIEARMDRPAKVTLKPRRSGEVEVTYADVSHSKAILGYEPHTSLEQGIDRTVEWYRGLDFAWE